MIIPQYWAEGRRQSRQGGKQMTVRRFGWSDAGQAEAQADADTRAEAALQRILGGEKIPRRDFKVPYGGGQGLPIREEILARHGDTIITRNSYRARCLNTPDAQFIDVDLEEGPAGKTYLIIFAAPTPPCGRYRSCMTTSAGPAKICLWRRTSSAKSLQQHEVVAMDDLVPAPIAENGLDFAALVAADATGIAGGIG
jgi:hypothetical protein